MSRLSRYTAATNGQRVGSMAAARQESLKLMKLDQGFEDPTQSNASSSNAAPWTGTRQGKWTPHLQLPFHPCLSPDVDKGKCRPHEPVSLAGARQETASGRMRKPRQLTSRGRCAGQRTTETRDDSAGHCAVQAFCRADTVSSRARALLWGGCLNISSIARGCTILHLFSHPWIQPTRLKRHLAITVRLVSTAA